jgi:predicted DCC family thiol-disulfide oxidoreductase YuxK
MPDFENSSRPVVFYDGGCPLCRREIAHYQRVDDQQRIEWVDIQRQPEQLPMHGLTYEQAMQRMHVRDSDGRMVSGAAAFAALWRHLPRYRWLAGTISLPGINWLGEKAYDVFARQRYRTRCNDQQCSGH